jgi:hypothetical protein
MLRYFIFLLLILILSIVIANREREYLTFDHGRIHNVRYHDVPSLKYDVIEIDIVAYNRHRKMTSHRVEAWHVYGPLYEKDHLLKNTNESTCIIVLPIACDKATRLQLVDNLLEICPSGHLFIFDWVGYGSTIQDKTTQANVYALFDQIHRIVEPFSKRVWVGHCIGSLFFMKHAVSKNLLNKSGEDRVLLINTLLSFFKSGVGFPSAVQWIPYALTWVLPNTTINELDAERDLKQLVDQKVYIKAIHTANNRHVNIDNGYAIRDIIGSQNFMEAYQMGHLKLNIKDQRVYDFISQILAT